MKPGIFKTGCCLLTAAAASLLLVSCGSDTADYGAESKTEEITAASSAVAEEAAANEEILLAQDGQPIYTIIRDEYADNLTVKAAISLNTGIAEKTGIEFRFGTDWLKKNTEPDMTTHEILVGVTNRTSEEEISALGPLEYKIRKVGEKIEILASSEKALTEAIEKFLSDEFISVDDGGNVTLKITDYSGKIELAMGEVPDFPYGDIEGVYESSDSTILIKAKNTTAEDYNNYIELLKSVGFSVYAENKINDNLFATLTSDKQTVNAYYISTTGVTRVVYEDKGALYPLTDDYTDLGIDCLITSMLGETVVAAEGMGFIIRLCDGSFIIIDGGMGDPDSIDSNKLMDILNTQKPEGTDKPVIAAWLFTHLHGDHIGVFNCFSIDHHDDVIIERLMYNFPKDEETAVSDSPYMLDDTIYRYTQFRKCLEEYYPDVPVVKLHTGNKFVVRNAEFEILETLEDIWPKTILDGGMNECSILYKMTLCGQTVLWTGDIAAIARDTAIEQFGDYLKADILQMAHHGMNGSVQFYSIIDPTYAFLPVWPGGFDSVRNYDQNKWLINSPNMKHLICTGYGSWTIRMPYNPVEGTYDRIPTKDTKNTLYPDCVGE